MVFAIKQRTGVGQAWRMGPSACCVAGPRFPKVGEALGDGVPLVSVSVTVETIMAVAYAAGELPKLLAGTPEDMIAQWESEIDDRGGLEDIGARADQARANADARAMTGAQRRAIDLAEAKDGKLSLGVVRDSMPCVVAGEVYVSGYRRLAKLSPATACISEARLKMLATRLRVDRPASADSTPTSTVHRQRIPSWLGCFLAARPRGRSWSWLVATSQLLGNYPG